MRKFICILLLIPLFQSCNFDESKIIGTWHVTSFTINGGVFYVYRLSTRNEIKAETIQFFENGFFILKINERYFDYGIQLENLKVDPHWVDQIVKWKGKWKIKSFSKIEIEFIDMPENIGIQSGSYEISKNSFIIDAKGNEDFIFLKLFRN